MMTLCVWKDGDGDKFFWMAGGCVVLYISWMQKAVRSSLPLVKN